ncbi:DUF1614 domain-containing protein [Bacillota bacterium Meth-B3]|nr:DUF1614 domain-containing protein [Christensenellaceae bacterium]MEA5064468.1 DUF1614 domain-containing protein [Eubacteriales bacterium]MEA5068331.1 DUF1614 domain-containing protein [Christensenellaceae bacterium]
MSIGLILLVVVAILILFGLAQRVLDRLRLTDRQALLFVGLIFVGGLIGDIPLGPMLSINLGGAVIPLILCVYLLVKAGTAWEKWRAVLAAVITGVAVWLLGRYFPNEPEAMPFDINYLYGLAGGVIAYVFGRSRRGAFIAGTLGVMLADIAQAIINWSQGVGQRLLLGGAGAMDAIVISGLLAVLLAELVGELIERAARGSEKPDDRKFEKGEFVRKERRK